LEKFNIYFDNAATTPHLPSEACENALGNPSSPHELGIRAERTLNAARADFAGILGCGANEIIFTSGGTESNCLAILGFAYANRRKNTALSAKPWEHPSVTEPIKFAVEQGLAEESDSSRGVRLVSISHVLNETGDLQNISEIAAKLKSENPETIVHADGVQSFCKENINLANIDMFTFSGHKIHGATGFGGLFIRKGVRLVPLLHGGGQESGIRAGTENLRGAIQTAHAAKILNESREKNHAHVSAVKNELRGLLNEMPDVFENTLGAEVSPYILNLSFLGIKGETLVHLLSEKGIYASMGAACRSRKKQKTALEAMGFPPERAQSAVRFSFSHLNTVEEAVIVREIIIECVAQIRRVLGRR
jgi:cysteine desulfurase